MGVLGLGIVLLYASSIRGCIVGGGDRRLGLGVAPIARLPIIIGLSTIVVLYATLLDFIVYKYRLDLILQNLSVPLWLILFDSLIVVVLAPLSEELFFRGWLWTGLRKHWGVLPTGLMTAVMWLMPHLDRGIYVVLLLFPALILTIAREVGKSVRATIVIHAIYNLTGIIVVFLKLFQNQGSELSGDQGFVTPSTEAASQQNPSPMTELGHGLPYRLRLQHVRYS